MVSYCANSGCGKPLHYLRDGRIYVFDASIGTSPAGRKRERHLEHYWLCGACAQILILTQDSQGWIHVVPRPAAIIDSFDELTPVPAERAS